MVRTAAEKTSTKLKNLRNGWDGDDHEQKITLAFWWIKQASRLALNLPIDRERALEIRNHDGRKKDNYEMKQTKEKREEEEQERNLWEKREMGIEKLMRARLKI